MKQKLPTDGKNIPFFCSSIIDRFHHTFYVMVSLMILFSSSIPNNAQIYTGGIKRN